MTAATVTGTIQVDGVAYTATAAFDVVDAQTAAVRWGMSSPADEWDARLAEVGPGLKARRVFDGGWNILGKVQQCVAGGLFPVASVKPGDWGDVIAGKANSQIDSLARSFAALDVPMAFTLHHEPGAGEAGTLQEWAQMIAYAARRVRAIAPKVMVGPVDNGFHFDDPTHQGFSDAQLDAYYTPDVLAAFDFLAADCYQGGTTANPGRDASTKVRGMTRFADRRGWAKAMGVGEYNGLDAAAIRGAQSAIQADPRFYFACVFNSANNNRPGVNWQLTGDRLAEFRSVLATT